MPRIPGFKSETQRERFFEAAKPYVRGGPLARTCGARLRTGGTCAQLALAGEVRCLRHGGPVAARRYRERQKAGLERGSVTPDEWARAEAKRARNALTWAWRKARAARKALRAGDMEGARAVVDALRAMSSAAVDVDQHRGQDAAAEPLTRLPVRPWMPRPAADGWKRRKADRQKAPPAPPRPAKPIGRPPRVPDGPEDLAAYGAVLREAGPQVRAMHEAIPRLEDRLRFLHDLAGYANAPDNAGAQLRWLGWVIAGDRRA